MGTGTRLPEPVTMHRYGIWHLDSGLGCQQNLSQPDKPGPGQIHLKSFPWKHII